MAKKHIVESKPEPITKTAEGITQANASVIYDLCARDTYLLFQWLMPPKDAEESLRIFASKIFLTAKKNNYERYARLLGFRIAIEILPMFPLKVPFGLSLKEGLALFLRERLNFECSEIASIMNCSEGSIRTRLVRTRTRLLNRALLAALDGEETTVPQRRHKPDSHLCIFSQQEIEDSTFSKETAATLKDFRIPVVFESIVAGCTDCTLAVQSRSFIAQEMKRIPAVILPQDLQRFPVSPLFVRKGQQTLMNWASAPWYLKVLLEGVLATTLVLGIVFSLPRIKSVYELWVEKHIDFNSLTDLATSLSHPTTDPLTEGAPRPQENKSTDMAVNEYGPPAPTTARAPTTTVTSEFSERDGATASSNKIYRIMIKTDAPDGIKTSVLKILSEYSSLSINGAPAEGIELPGGIMFDIYVPLKNYKGVLSELGHLGDTKVIITQSRSESQAGKARLKIWLQRI